MRLQLLSSSQYLGYLKLAFRNLRRDRLYSFLNLAGLAFSFSCFLVIFLYLKNELSYDQHFEDSSRIYRLDSELELTGNRTRSARIGSQIAPLLAQDYTQFEEFARLDPFEGKGMLFISDNERMLWDQMSTIYGADNSVFDFFDLTATSGNVETALTEPRSIALSESMARILFGDEDPIGKSLGVQFSSNVYTVVLVFADLPRNTSHWFNVLFSHSTLTYPPDPDNFFEQGIINPVSHTFFRFPAESDPASYSNILTDFSSRYVMEGVQRAYSGQNPRMDFHLLPLENIYLSEALEGDVPKGNPIVLTALTVVAVFILGTASINYMNLSTARFARRAKEMGVRRTLGASRESLAVQILLEGVLFSLLALMLGIGLSEALLIGPLDQILLGQNLSIFSSDSGTLLIQSLLIASTLGLISGAYPALYFSSIQAVDIFRPVVRVSRLGINLRALFIGLQMLVTISVVGAALVMFQQVNYMKNRPLGFEKDNKLVVWVNTIATGSDYRSVITELVRHPGIKNVSMADEIPGSPVYGESLSMRNDQGENVSIYAETHSVDENYLNTFAIPLVAGRDFPVGNRSTADVELQPYLVNEALVSQMGWENPIGRQLTIPAFDINGEVIGVFADYNFSSLHQQVRPQFVRFFYDDFRWQRYLVMDIDPGDIQNILTHVEEQVAALMPYTPFEYAFLDETLDGQYAREESNTQLILIGSAVCIFISILGLFGLTAYTIDQKTKEIGIRRVLGASVIRILATLFKGLLTVTIFAGIVSSVLILYAMNLWLEGFAYRISISPITVFSAISSALAVVVVTVGIQSARVSRNEPAKALRTE